MANYGIKIAKQGFNVTLAATKNLVFHSSYPCAKIIQQGSISAVNIETVNFNANVSFPIMVYSFIKDGTTYYPAKVTFNSTNFTLSDRWGNGFGSGTYYYFVFYS